MQSLTIFFLLMMIASASMMLLVPPARRQESGTVHFRKAGNPMEVTHNFMLKDGTIVDKLPPEEEEKFWAKMRQSFADTVVQMMQQRRPDDRKREAS